MTHFCLKHHENRIFWPRSSSRGVLKCPIRTTTSLKMFSIYIMLVHDSFFTMVSFKSSGFPQSAISAALPWWEMLISIFLIKNDEDFLAWGLQITFSCHFQKCSKKSEKNDAFKRFLPLDEDFRQKCVFGSISPLNGDF